MMHHTHPDTQVYVLPLYFQFMILFVAHSARAGGNGYMPTYPGIDTNGSLHFALRQPLLTCEAKQQAALSYRRVSKKQNLHLVRLYLVKECAFT